MSTVGSLINTMMPWLASFQMCLASGWTYPVSSLPSRKQETLVQSASGPHSPQLLHASGIGSALHQPRSQNCSHLFFSQCLLPQTHRHPPPTQRFVRLHHGCCQLQPIEKHKLVSHAPDPPPPPTTPDVGVLRLPDCSPLEEGLTGLTIFL